MANKVEVKGALAQLRNKLKEIKSSGTTELITSVKPQKSYASKVERELAALASEVSSCTKCPLGLKRIKAVFGDGYSKAAVMFVGEGPGYEEDRQGLPFVGKAGKLLDKMMISIGLDRNNSYIANIVKCHPMIDPTDPEKRGNDRPPTAEEAAGCIAYLKKQIELINPKTICVLGATAMRYLLGIEEAIGKVRGKLMDFENRKVIVTYHPAALLRNPSLKPLSWEDLKLLRSYYKQERE